MRPNIVWVTLESFRADHTSLSESGVDLTPNLRRIAADREGQWFGNCYAHAHWTPASSTSILTGTYVPSHGVGYDDAVEVTKVPPGLSTVPELLGDEGYRTACLTGNGYLSAAGLERGFDRFDTVTKDDFVSGTGAYAAADYLFRSGFVGRGMSFDLVHHLRDCFKEWYQTVAFRRWLADSADAGSPFFAYMHLNNAHHPYRPPRPVLEQVLADSDRSPSDVVETADEYSDSIWERIADGGHLPPTEREAVLAAYEGEVRYSDRLLGRVFDYLRDRDDTVLVVTADHGELFGEAGALEHNLVLHDDLINVPLVTYGLDFPDRHGDALVQHIDVMQTVLDTVGADTSQFQGYDLRDETREFAVAHRGPRHSDIEKLRDLNPAFDTDRFHGSGIGCVRSRDWKYQRSGGRAELFRLPDESTDRSAEFPAKTGELAEVLDTHVPTERFESSERAEFDDEMEAHLRDMGYLD